MNGTETTNGLGNLIVGYNESRGPMDMNTRTGSHNVVIGEKNNYAQYGGLVTGSSNEISGPFATIVGGTDSAASGYASSVSGGYHNGALSQYSVVSGSRDATTRIDYMWRVGSYSGITYWSPLSYFETVNQPYNFEPTPEQPSPHY